MKTNCTNFLLFVLLLVGISLPSIAQKKLLLIGDNETISVNAADQDIFDSLSAWGYEVTYIYDDIYNITAGTDVYDGMDGVFINEPVGSKFVTKFGADNYPLPSIVLEGSAVETSDDRWGWVDMVHHSGVGNASELDLSIIIIDNSHYITSIYTVDQEIKWADFEGTYTDNNLTASLEEQNVIYSGKLAVNKALIDNTTVWNMITVDSSGSFPNNLFFWSISSASLAGEDRQQHYGTADYYTIIKRACQWAFNEEEAVNTANRKLQDARLVAFPNPAVENVTVRFYAPGAVNAKVGLYDITGQKIQILLDKVTVAGNNFVIFKAYEFAPGVYFVNLEMEGKSAFSKIVIQ